MLKPAFEQRSVSAYVDGVRDVLHHDELRDAVQQAARQIPGDQDAPAKLRQVMPSPGPGNESSGWTDAPVVPYLSRSPVVSLVQSSLEEALLARGAGVDGVIPRNLWQHIVYLVRRLWRPGDFTPADPGWVIDIALATLGHLARGNHPFNPQPATHAISADARLVVVGDWGTGLPRAQAVARQMARDVGRALADGRDAHVVHLGDVYYSGLPSENERHVLAYWPVTDGQAAAGVTSWSLNGNHDMYSGGFGYFQTLLGDDRFAAQRSPDGRPTSYFRLTSPAWDFVGLDTSWDGDVLSNGARAVLADPQADFVASVAAESDRKMVLFSHHQLVSVYDQTDIGPELTGKLGSVLDSGRVTAWWWGHEHRSMGFAPVHGVQYPRCLGHGGVPVLQPHAPDDPIPAPAVWEDRSVLDLGGRHWARFGYAVLDLAGESITVRYVDETGAVVRTEQIT